jgi:hypothetical protein
MAIFDDEVKILPPNAPTVIDIETVRSISELDLILLTPT